MTRKLKAFSLPMDVIRDLERRSRETGEHMSRIVETSLRTQLGLTPVTAPPDHRGTPAVTRVETMLLTALRGRRGWLTSWQLMRLTSLSANTVDKNMLLMAHEGRVVRWGDGMCITELDGPVLYGGDLRMHRRHCWGLEQPLPLVRQALGHWTRAGILDSTPELSALVVGVVRRLALGMAEAPEARRLTCEAFECDEERADVWNFAEANARYHAQQKIEAQQRADEAKRETEARRAQQRAHDAEQKRLDMEYRTQHPGIFAGVENAPK